MLYLDRREMPSVTATACRGAFFLQIGGLALGGLSLPRSSRAEDKAGIRNSQKSIIMVFLSGGPPHQDMVDLKPDAPVEIRGEFKPIATKVPGIRICEHLPKLARRMDRLAVIRSLVGSEGQHSAFQCMHGRTQQRQPGGGWPSLGSTVSKLRGAAVPGVSPFVGLSPKMITSTWANVGNPGFLGPAHAAFKPNADGMGSMVLKGLTLEQLGQRRAKLMKSFLTACAREGSGFERFLRAGADEYTRQALSILTSSKLAEALDLEREPARIRDWYGRGDPKPAGYGDAGPLMNDYLLTARRLVEAGVRVVTLAYGRWDWHGKPYGTTFENARHHLPILDQGLCAPDRRPEQTRARQGRDGAGVGRVRSDAGDQQGGRARPLAFRRLRPAGGWRHEDRPGDRIDRFSGSPGEGSACSFPGGVRHPLPQPRARSTDSDGHRSAGSAAVPRR